MPAGVLLSYFHGKGSIFTKKGTVAHATAPFFCINDKFSERVLTRCQNIRKRLTIISRMILLEL